MMRAYDDPIYFREPRNGERRIKLAVMNPEIVADEIGKFIVAEITNIGRVGGVVGLSGGVDSTTVAALAKRAFDKYNLLNPDKKKLSLTGYMLPSKLNSPDDLKDAVEVAEKLEIEYEVVDLEPMIQSYKKTLPEMFDEKNKMHRGNMISEIRANILHAKSALERKLVIGTGNHDEDFCMAYYTLFGDGAVHMSPIGEMPKRLVRQMSAFLGFEKSAAREPVAGLEPGQTDFRDLGSYYDLPEIIDCGIKQKFSLKEIACNSIFSELAQEQITEYEKKFGFKKLNNEAEIIDSFIIRNKIAKGKARIISPPIAKITLDYI